MDKFFLRELKNCNNEKELESIGFDSSYRFRAKEKMDCRLIKIKSLTPAQANIIKQTALSIGADCMTHREVITGKEPLSDAILVTNTTGLYKIAQKLLHQPFKLKILAEQLLEFTKKQERKKTKLVGILNITPDSFSDGGNYLKIEDAQKHLLELIQDGADMIDIGAESTKPYSLEVDAKTQLNRLLPIIDFIKKEGITIPISIDTRNSIVADEVLKRGQFIINDVSGFDHDNNMISTLAKHNAKAILQHSRGNPETMQNSPSYTDVMEDIFISMQNKIAKANELGVTDLIIDPGIGFGKTKEHNLEIIRRIEELYQLNYPVMVGISRKSMLGIIQDNNELKDTMTLAVNSSLIEKGIDYLRVHNVKLHRTFLDNIY